MANALNTSSSARRQSLALLATLALAASAAAPASAASVRPSAPTFALTPVGAPGALLLQGAPGRTLRGAVLVRNVSNRRITVRLRAADIRNAANGNADYVTTPLQSTGRWLHLSATTVQLPRGQSRRVNFSVRVPRDVPGGSAYAGIVAVDTADLTAAAAARTRGVGRSFAFKRINRQGLPLTIRTRGVRTRTLTLRSLTIAAQSAGAALVVGLRPGGSDLISGATLKLRVTRDGRKVFGYAASLGQLFPGSGLDYRVPWVGRPTPGRYRVIGVIRPLKARAIYIDRTVGFSGAKAAELARRTPVAAGSPTAGVPPWVLPALAAALCLVAGLLFAVWKLSRRRPREMI